MAKIEMNVGDIVNPRRLYHLTMKSDDGFADIDFGWVTILELDMDLMGAGLGRSGEQQIELRVLRNKQPPPRDDAS